MRRATDKARSARPPTVARILEVLSLPLSPRGRYKLRKVAEFRLGAGLYPLARLYRRTLIRRTHVVVVIGSMGKTTTTRAVAAALGQDAEAVEGWNAKGFLASFLLRIHPGERTAVAEVGIKHKGVMERFARLLRPDTVVVTSIATEHHRYLGPIESIRVEKARMVSALQPTGIAVLNGDDTNVLWMREQTSARVLTYGFEPANDVRATNYVSRGVDGSEFAVCMGGETWRVRTRLIGRHMVYAILAALTVARAEGISMEGAIRAIRDLPPTPHRLRPVKLHNDVVLLMDDYKVTFETIEAAMETLSAIDAPRRTLVLGEIFEPPGSPEDLYRQLGRRSAESADRVFFLGSDEAFAALSEGGRSGRMGDDRMFKVGGVHEAAKALLRDLLPREVILLKGIGTLRLERIALMLEGEQVSCRRDRCRALITYKCADCLSLGNRDG